jgi:hypothetical protein
VLRVVATLHRHVEQRQLGDRKDLIH